MCLKEIKVFWTKMFLHWIHAIMCLKRLVCSQAMKWRAFSGGVELRKFSSISGNYGDILFKFFLLFLVIGWKFFLFGQRMRFWLLGKNVDSVLCIFELIMRIHHNLTDRLYKLKLSFIEFIFSINFVSSSFALHKNCKQNLVKYRLNWHKLALQHVLTIDV